MFACTFDMCIKLLLDLTWVPTADHGDQINSTIPIAKIPRPSLSELDHYLVGLVRDLFPTESAGVWSSSDRVVVELIGY